MTLAKFIKLLDENFQKELAAKTSWGRNDLINVYNKAKTEALAKMVDDELEKTTSGKSPKE